MATTKKTAAETANETKKKGGGGERNSAGDFETEYIRLRTILDGLEICSLRYCLEGKKRGDRIRRIQEIDRMLKPVVEQLRKLMDKLAAPAEGRCPDGFYECDGCCVPYPCPNGYHGGSNLAIQKERAR